MESSDAIRNQCGDGDPLLAFEQETFDVPPAPQNSAHSSAMATAIDLDLAAVLRSRVVDAERVIEKSQETIANLTNRVETLVCAVADLNKRLDREKTIARMRNAMPSLPRERQRVLPRDGHRVLPRDWSVLARSWQRVWARDWHSVLPRDWQRVLPRDRQRALVLGTVMMMATLAIALVALVQGFDAQFPSASVPMQAAANTPVPDQPPAFATPPESTTTPQQPVSPSAQRVRAKVVAPIAAELRASDPRPSTADRAANMNASLGAARTGQYVGTLTIDSDPPGEAFVNRRRVGRTPVTVEDLRAGSHLIWIVRDGYRRWTRVVEVPANRISRVSTALEPDAR